MLAGPMSLPEFSLQELSQYNGKNGRPAFIACQGKVYDVTRSFQWKKGEHQVLHRAGNDLTVALKDAPHGVEFLLKFPLVGVLLSGRPNPDR
jgi:predicted heme/steroid binding protein